VRKPTVNPNASQVGFLQTSSQAGRTPSIGFPLQNPENFFAKYSDPQISGRLSFESPRQRGSDRSNPVRSVEFSDWRLLRTSENSGVNRAVSFLPSFFAVSGVRSMKMNFAKDVPASLVVFLVALPLSIGIAVASGAPVQAGLIAAICGGIIVGLTGGAPMQVSGPAAGLTVMVAGFVAQFGFKAMGVVIVMAGVIQIIAGIAKVAKAAMAISPAVLHAMLAGIGILITLGQLHVILGAKPGKSALMNLQNIPGSLANLNFKALIVGLATLATLLLWNKFVAPKFKAVPGSLVAIMLGTALSFLIPGDINRVALAAGLMDGFSLPNPGENSWFDLVKAAIALTVVASAESLLCAVATDQLHKGPRANLDKELLAQGLGNTVSGLLGGLPMTGVIVRSSANIAAGATSSLSATLHGVWILVFVLLGASVLQMLPMAALAALLIHVGVNLVKVKEMKKIARFNEFIIYAVTLAGVVFINLLWGIGIGFVLAFALLMFRQKNSSMGAVTKQTTADLKVNATGNTVDAALSGRLSFLTVPSLMGKLRELPAKQTVSLTFNNVETIDHAAVEAISAWKVGYVNEGGLVEQESIESVWDRLDGNKAVVTP
jgi:carbonic anhydrase